MEPAGRVWVLVCEEVGGSLGLAGAGGVVVVPRLVRAAALPLLVLGTIVGMIVGLAAGLVVGTATPASAHATLLFATPAAETAVPEPPRELTLIFDEPVTLPNSAVRLAGPTGRAVSLGAIHRGQAGRVVSVPVGVPVSVPPAAGGLPGGVYTVRWQVVARDGDLVSGQYRFVVGPALAGAAVSGDTARDGAGPPVSWPVAGLRWLLFAGLALALGGRGGDLLARWIAGGRAREAVPSPPRPWLALGAAIGLVAAAGLAALLAGRGALTGGAGLVVAAEAAGFAAALLLARAGRPGWATLALLAVVAAEAARAHPAQSAPGWGAALTAVHLTAVALWIGGLIQVTRTCLRWRSAPAPAWRLVALYARFAIWVLAVVVATGAAEALLLVDPARILTTTYGRLLIIKIGLFLVVSGLAVTARLRLRRGPARPGRRPPAVVMRVEGVALVAVLAATAILTSGPTPRPVSRALAVAPPPVGLVLPLGGRAGQIGVAVTASTGQVVVRLTAPGADDPGIRPPRYRLAATLADPAGRRVPLRLRPCGTGCFFAPIGWRNGTSRLTLGADARGWRGGTTALTIAWPPSPAPDALAKAVAATRRAASLTLYEEVTSDTTRPAPNPMRLRISGQRFISAQPYSNGRAPQAVRLPLRLPGSRSVLAVGFPTVGQYSSLILTPDGRIEDEVQVDGTHLITRHLVYPDRE